LVTVKESHGRHPLGLTQVVLAAGLMSSTSAHSAFHAITRAAIAR